MAFPSFGEACLAQAMKVAPSPHQGQRSEMEVKKLFESFKERFNQKCKASNKNTHIS